MSSKKKTKKTVARYARTVQKSLRNSLRECVNGCGRAKATHRYCADCGTALPGTASTVPTLAKSHPTVLPAPAFVAKGMSEAPTDPLWFGHRDDNDSDPAVREAAWRQTYDRRLVTKSQASTVENAPLLGDPSSADPAERELAWQQAFNHANTKGR